MILQFNAFSINDWPIPNVLLLGAVIHTTKAVEGFSNDATDVYAPVPGLTHQNQRQNLNQRYIIPFLLVSVIALTAGCKPEPEIVRYTIPKDRSGLEKLRQPATSPPGMSSQAAEARSTRMVVAIFQNPDATWFFKVSGPAEQVAKTEDQWKPFFQSVRFQDGEPSWDMPQNWTVAGPKPMRHATLIIENSEPPLELAISKLGPDQDLLLNVNRWRGQIGLSPSTNEALSGQIEKNESEAGKYLVFDAEGTGSGEMKPPFAGGGAPFANREPLAPVIGQDAGTPAKKLKYDIPEGWSEGKTSSIVHARLIRKVESAEVQITVIEMPADANEWEPNVARWANQVGLGGLSAEQMAERVSDLTVDGVEGKSIDLVDLESDSPTGTIAGMVKRDGSAWFLKLSGDKKQVEESREVFKQFLGSVRFN